MAESALSEALKEAYASAPSDVIILHTLEIRHPSFIDDDGNPTAIRIVRDYNNLMARMEDTAPVNKGEVVEFQSFAFDLSLPTVNDKAAPELTVTIDNVSREIIRNIERAVESREVIKMTYRPYLSTDPLSGPHYDPPLHLTLTDIVADVFRVSGRAGFGDLANNVFPSILYSPLHFPGLVR